MKYCNDCKMSVDTDRSYCPLCGDELKKIDDEKAISFPTAVTSKNKGKQNFLSKLLLAFSAVGAFVCVIINIATYKIAPVKWSVIVAVGAFYCWHLISRCIMKKGNATKVLFRQLLTISLLLFCIDVFLTDFSMWSVCYAIPFLSLSISVAIMVIALANMLYFRDHLHYSIATLALCTLQSIWLFTAPIKWGIITSTLTAIIAFTVIFTVAQKGLAGEMKKRLHL